MIASKQGKLGVVYNLYEVEGLYLTNAFIVSIDPGGEYTHIRQKATAGTVDALGLERDDAMNQLFTINDLLTPKVLEARFSPPKKKVQTLKNLLLIPEIKQVIIKYLDRQKAVFFETISKYALPFSYMVERQVLVKDYIVQTGDFVLKPKLSFQKLEAGVRYRLRLMDGAPWNISSKEVFPVCNHPAWVIVDDRLFFIEHINGNMVKPFQQKDELLIPPASVVTYFKKFIIKVAEKAEIEADGFDLVAFDHLDAKVIKVSQDIFTDEWGLNLEFRYHNAHFRWSDKVDNRTSLSIQGEDIRILKISRDFSMENKVVEQLRSMGFENRVGSLFYLVDDGEKLDLMDWLGANIGALKKAGFVVDEAIWQDKAIYLSRVAIDFSTRKENDWFDVLATVKVGEFSFPFAKLGWHIRENNRFYLLPNGQWFVIPLEWMSKYQEFFRFAKVTGDQIKLVKSQYTLLEAISSGDGVLGASDPDEIIELPALLKAELRPYQLEGYHWLVQLYRNQLGACLADDMGLGKTLQTIAMLLYAKEQKSKDEPAGNSSLAGGQLDLFAAPDNDFLKPLNALIILPASLVFNWVNELNKFAPTLTVYRHVGPKRHKDIRLLSRFDVILTTYQTALRDEALLRKSSYEYIVLDESQHIKNRQSKVFKAINEFDGKHKISLSGTPIENSLSDLWSQMQFINPDLLNNYNFFKKEFITPIERRNDEVKKAQLRSLVAPYLLRRTKEEVAGDLPPLTVQIVYTEMTTEQSKLYEREKSAARNYLIGNFKPKDAKYRLLVLQSITKLRLLSNHPVLVKPEYTKESGKFTEVLELMSTIRKAGHKTLVFSSFVKFLDRFESEFTQTQIPFSKLTGANTGKQRELAVKQFQTIPSIQTFLISIKAGGTGLNLTAADYVFILDPWWNPTTEDQAIARAHRIGQEKSVIALKFISKGSIEEKILRLQERKSRLAEDIIGQHPNIEISKDEIAYLLE